MHAIALKNRRAAVADSPKQFLVYDSVVSDQASALTLPFCITFEVLDNPAPVDQNHYN